MGNVGMHNAHDAEKLNSDGHIFRKKSIYHPKQIKGQFELYLNKSTECIAYVKKMHIQHWALKEIGTEFKVNCLNDWHIHPINITNIFMGKNYTTLVESSKGPIIIEHNKTLAAQFSVDPRYPETIKILNNFLRKKILDLKSSSRHHYDSNRRSLYTNKFVHSGHCYSRRHGIYISTNNAIFDVPLKVETLQKKSHHKKPYSASIKRVNQTVESSKQTFKRLKEDLMRYATIDNSHIDKDKELPNDYVEGNVRLNMKTRASNKSRLYSRNINPQSKNSLRRLSDNCRRVSNKYRIATPLFGTRNRYEATNNNSFKLIPF